MTGVCGISKQKVKHHYYICSAKKKKLCTKSLQKALDETDLA